MDDIVERLREEEYVCCGEHYERDAYCRSCVLHAEAADEIERLRKEVDLKGYRLDDALDEIKRLRTAGDNLAYWLRAETVNGSMAVCEGTTDALQAWQEARRG